VIDSNIITAPNTGCAFPGSTIGVQSYNGCAIIRNNLVLGEGDPTGNADVTLLFLDYGGIAPADPCPDLNRGHAVSNNTLVITKTTSLTTFRRAIFHNQLTTYADNIFIGSGSDQLLALDTGATAPDFQHNIFACINTTGATGAGNDSSFAATCSGNPLAFADLATGNYYLTASSPSMAKSGGIDTSQAICGAGGDRNCGDVTLDFDGNARVSPNYGLGAFGVKP
jgi:hypothetical protein